MASDFNDAESADTLGNSQPKKRVLFVITQSELGGAQQFLIRLLEKLDRRHFEMQVVIGVDGNKEIRNLIPKDVICHTAEHLYRDPHIFRDDWLAIHDVNNFIKSFRPDVLFLMSSKAGFVGSMAGWFAKFKFPKLKIVYRIGGWTFNDPWPTWKKTIYILLERISARLKDYIIVNSLKDYQDAKYNHIEPRHDVLLIHNGIDPYMEFMPRQEARIKLFERMARINFEKNSGGQAIVFQAQSIVGTIANFYPTKNLSLLIQAAEQTDDNTLFIIIGDGQLRQNLEEQIKELGLEKKVYLLGKIEEAYKYITAFDIFVLPSIKEGFPWTVLEAMAAKVPVIATPVGAVTEIIQPTVTGLLVNPKDSKALAEAINELSSNEGYRRQLAMQAHQQLIKSFSLAHMVDQYERFLLKI